MRSFEITDAKRERVPIWIGLFGPPGSGKTYSALRVATGIAAETGSRIAVIDTEARRSLHYAGDFSYRHLDLAAPFSSGTYLDAVTACVSGGSGIVIIDSQSHEHEGPGGLLDAHDAILDKIAGDDYGKRQASNWQAWREPKRERTRMVNALLQLPVHLIFCHRAKEKSGLQKTAGGRSAIVDMGWAAIGDDQLLYNLTVNLLLPPNSRGVPKLKGDTPQEQVMIKVPKQFEALFADSRPLDEEHGRAFAKWAAGGEERPAQGQYTAERVSTVLAEAAANGTEALRITWAQLPKHVQAEWKGDLDGRFKPIAAKIDAAITTTGRESAA